VNAATVGRPHTPFELEGSCVHVCSIDCPVNDQTLGRGFAARR
jgi:hypothetical protein